MHSVDIPQWATKVALKRRGVVHPYAALDGRRTALVVIDLQNAFLVREHAVAFVPHGLDIVENVNRVANAVRDAGGGVFWVQNTVDEPSLASWTNWFAMGLPATVERSIATMSRGTPGHALYAGLDVRPEDTCVEKYRFSAFIQGGSDLAQRLHKGGYDTVIIAGVATNVCCESSARDAAMLNFKTIMIADATATSDDDVHNAALATFYAMFGDVMETEFICACLQNAAASTTI